MLGRAQADHQAVSVPRTTHGISEAASSHSSIKRCSCGDEGCQPTTLPLERLQSKRRGLSRYLGSTSRYLSGFRRRRVRVLIESPPWPAANSHRAREGCSIVEGVWLLVNPWRNSGQSVCPTYNAVISVRLPVTINWVKWKGSANFGVFFLFSSILRVNSLHGRVPLPSEGSS